MATNTPVTTEAALRRLLEALATVESTTAGGIEGFRLGMPIAIAQAQAAGLPQLGAVFEAIDALAVSVLADMKGNTHA